MLHFLFLLYEKYRTMLETKDKLKLEHGSALINPAVSERLRWRAGKTLHICLNMSAPKG